MSGPIFIVGTGRSGTTLLRLMLCAHPRIYITHEASFYMWERFHRRLPRREFLEYYFQTPSFRWLRVDPDRIRAVLPDPLPRDQMGLAYGAVMREKAAQYGRPRYGDKTPLHATALPRIFADFPDARVIHIVRDPRATALSLSRMPWSCANLHANARFCDYEVRKIAEHGDRVLQIRLEDLLAEPRATMEAVLDHVGEPWSDDVLDHVRCAPDRTDMPPLPWFESSMAAARTPSREAWRELSPADIRTIERAAPHVMAAAGYEPAALPAEPNRLSLWWQRVRAFSETTRYLLAYARCAWLARDPRNFDSPPLDRAFRQINPASWAHYPALALPETPPLISGQLPPPDADQSAPYSSTPASTTPPHTLANAHS